MASDTDEKEKPLATEEGKSGDNSVGTTGSANNTAPAEVLLVDSDEEPMEMEGLDTPGPTVQLPGNGVDSDSSIEIEAEVLTASGASKPKKRRKILWQCLNPECDVSRKENLVTANSFVLSCFQVEHDERRKRKVCLSCEDKVMRTKNEMVERMARKKPILGEPLTVYKDMVLLEDSDDQSCTDESLSTDCELDLGSGEEGESVEHLLNRLVEEKLKDLDVEGQVTSSCASLIKRMEDLQPSLEETEQTFNSLESLLDNIRKELYQDFQPRVEIREEIDISDEAPVAAAAPPQRKLVPIQPAPPHGAALQPIRSIAPTQQQHSQLPFVPPPGPMERPPLTVGSQVYVMRQNVLSIWRLGKVDEILSVGEDLQYKVKLEMMMGGKKTIHTKIFERRQMAYESPAKWKLPVGTRCIGLYKENNQKPNQEQKSSFYSGIIAEPPKTTNRNRYLVFFDDGYASYIPHNEIRVVCHSSANVWDDIHPNSRDFIKSYLEQYPERPMVKLTANQVVKTEWDGRWWITRVKEVDSSLVKLTFDLDGREEWIYRGSTRLGPLYTEMEQQRQRREQQASGLMHRRQAYRKPGQNVPYIQYTRIEPHDSEQSEASVDADGAPTRKATNVARKSTTTTKRIEAAVDEPSTKWESDGSVVPVQLERAQGNKFKKHQCSPRCLSDPAFKYNEDALRGSNPLAIPLAIGWQRLICRPAKKKSRVMYVAPCGRSLRNLEEVHRYLRITQSQLEIDFFNFDSYCKVLIEFNIERVVCRIKDLSYGKENVPISCVNSIDKNYPEYLEYSTVRLPKEKVFINTDEEFLIGCDCTDDCQDKESCACHQLTIQATVCGHARKMDSSVGYQFRRLHQVVLTGIYECNKKCSCAKTCLNRVAQNPLRQKLQVFKTQRRGWGIRTLCDIPKGAFICIYVGNLFENEEANKQGQNYGDEYFADLDLIETVERRKEGYESDVSDIEEDEPLPQYSGPSTPANNSSMYPTDISSEEELSADKGDDDKDFNPLIKISRNSARADRQTRTKRRNSLLTGKEEGLAGNRRSGTADTSQLDGAVDNSDEDMEILDVKINRRGGGFTATAGITGPKTKSGAPTFKSTRRYFGQNEDVYIMDAKSIGNIGRYLNHSCQPNVFVQNVFVDTHDLRFPWVAFFSSQYIRAGQELCWDYNYEVGSIPGKELYCACGAEQCKGRLL